MGAFIDLTGQKFGKLIAKNRYIKNNLSVWHCVCDCGGAKEVLSTLLRSDVGPRCCDLCKEPIASPQRIDITNQQFGLLIVKSYQKNNKWLCVCECGQTTIVDSKHLRKGHILSCGKKGCRQSNKPIIYDLTNTRFGYLIAKTFINGTGKWECVCDCGKIVNVSSHSLRNKEQKSCGCKTSDLQSETRTLPDNMAAINCLYRSYKSSAKRRNIILDIPIDIFIELIYKNCFYCNSEPTMSSITTNSGKPKKQIAYNGIDRIHNEFGYTLDNCISCCRICNRAKSDMPYEEFMAWIERMLKYRTNIIGNCG